MIRNTLSRQRNTALHISVILILLASLMLILSSHTFAASGATGSAKIIAESGAYLRGSSSTFSEKVDLLPADTELVIYKEVFKSKTSIEKEKIWYYVKAGSKTGYVRADLVSDVRYSEIGGTAKNAANYRIGPGVKMDKRGTLSKNASVTVCIDAEADKGAEGSSLTWYKIRQGSSYCYVCSSNVKITGTVQQAPAETPVAQKAEETPAAVQTAAPAPAPAPVYSENTATVDQVRAALGSSTPVKGTVIPDTVTVLKSANSGAEAVADLNQNATVTVKAVQTSSEQVESDSGAAQSTVQWYEVEFETSQAFVAADPESDDEGGARPAYLAEDQSEDRELEAENSAVEKELAGPEDETDDSVLEESDDDADADGSAYGAQADANGIIRGYVRAEDIAAFLAK